MIRLDFGWFLSMSRMLIIVPMILGFVLLLESKELIYLAFVVPLLIAVIISWVVDFKKIKLTGLEEYEFKIKFDNKRQSKESVE